MIINNLNWAQVNDAIEIFENKGIEFNEPMCIDRENGIYEIEILDSEFNVFENLI